MGSTIVDDILRYYADLNGNIMQINMTTLTFRHITCDAFMVFSIGLLQTTMAD